MPGSNRFSDRFRRQTWTLRALRSRKARTADRASGWPRVWIFARGRSYRQSRPARRLGDAKSAAEPGAAACSPDGGKRRRTAGEATSGPKSPRACRMARTSTRARRNSVARRVFVAVGNRRSCRGGDCPYLLRGPRRMSPTSVSGFDAPPDVTISIVCGANARWVFPFPRLARVRHDRRPARSLGDGTSEAEPPAAACSPGGGQRRRTAGEARSGPMSPRACRSLRDLHEGTPKQRSAAGLRGRRKTVRLAGRRLPPFYSGAGRAG